MKILYLSLSYVPSRRASSVHVMKMCAALARQGHSVELVTKGCRERQEPDVDDAHEFYGVAPNFELLPLPRPAARGGGAKFLWHQRRLLRHRRTVDLVFARDLWGAWLATRAGLPVIFEAHGLPAGRIARKLQASVEGGARFRRLVVISDALRERLQRIGLARGAVLVAHDAADPGVEMPPARRSGDARPAVGYVGHLYAGRGIELIAELATRLPEVDFHLIGGRPEDIARWRQRASANLKVHGFVPPALLPERYLELDILVMPYQRSVAVAGGRSDTSGWMSPMKMFESMAAHRPIVSSDLPVLREVLVDGENALLVAPEDVQVWESALRRLIANPELGHRLASRARADLIAHYTWDARAAKILEGL